MNKPSARSIAEDRRERKVETSKSTIRYVCDSGFKLSRSGRRPAYLITTETTRVRVSASQNQTLEMNMMPFSLLVIGAEAEALQYANPTEVMIVETECATDLENRHRGICAQETCRHADILNAIQMIRRHILSNEERSDEYIDACVAVLTFRASMLLRRKQRPKLRKRFGHEQWQILSDFIDQRLDQPITVADLANAVGYSTSQCSKAFKATVGVPPQEYIRERRLARAREMLAFSDASLVEIAFETGYCSQAHMTATFSRILGVTPAGYRKDSISDS